jgi:periplasmic protein TonB
LFDQTFVDSQASARRQWTVGGSLILQTALVAVVLILPLLRTASLELPVKVQIRLPLEKVDLRLKPDTVKSAAIRASSAPRPVFHLALTGPTKVPRRIDLTPDAPALATADAINGPAAGSVFGGLLPEMVVQRPARTPITEQPKPVPSSAPIRVGGGVQSARLVFGPKPAYPKMALTTRTQGVVKIQALIGRDGVIRNLEVVSGPALLIAAAMDAVRQWRYQPTLLNGEPVEVITEIDVNFTLGQ